MRRILVAVCGLALLLPAACSSSTPDRSGAVRQFVTAWADGGTALTATLTGKDAAKAGATLAPLRAAGVVGTALLEHTQSGNTVRGVVGLTFADGDLLRVTIRANVHHDRVTADPEAVSAALHGWTTLRVVASESPAAGAIESRDGTALARGPIGHRLVARPALAPAVALIDAALRAELGGHPARRLVTATGQVLAESPLRNGSDVMTSLDDRVQAAAEAILGTTPGALVAVDPRTGGIRALVSNPERTAPGVSPATAGYSAGSAFKLVTAAAAFDTGTLTPDTVVQCPTEVTEGERVITNYEGHGGGAMTLQRAFAISCNTAFAQLGVSLGAPQLLRTAQQLGLHVGALDRPGTVSVPRSRGELAVWSFGAAGSLVSPLELTGIAATIARGGTSLAPAWTDRGGPGVREMKASTAAALVRMMQEVVRSGTGTAAAVPGLSLAGKTGTADPRRPGVGSDAWFVALAPAQQTRLAVTAFLPGAGVGGDTAAPLVRAFLIAARASASW